MIVELKACRAIADEHVAQILGYLKSARIDDGLLMNFGSYKFEIKKYVMNQDATQSPPKSRGVFLSAVFACFAFLCGKCA